MGDVVGDLLHAGHQLADAVEHGVEVVRQPVELVAGAGDGEPAVRSPAMIDAAWSRSCRRCA